MDSLPLKKNSGQTTVEYIVLLAVLVGISVLILNKFRQFNITERVMRPVKADFARTYQHGSPKVKGFDDQDGPQYHPRAGSAGNFRIFISEGRR